MKLSDKFEIKIFILYLLEKVDRELEFDEINDIVVIDGVVSYFDFADAFAELVDGGLIEIKPDGKKYAITETGRSAVTELEDKLYGSIKEKALRSALRVLAFRSTGGRTSASVESNGDGYDVICSITDAKRTLFSVKVYVTEREYAERLRDDFDSDPEKIYKGVLALLSGDVNYIFE